MDDESALLAAVYGAPREDAPRLVYGDWLLERGDPRGELIALQYRTREGELEDAAQEREAQLLEEHAEAWLGPLASAVSEPVFSRGFLHSAAVVAFDEALDRTSADPRWSTLEAIVVERGQAGAAATPAARLVSRLGNLQRIALACDTAEAAPEWAAHFAPVCAAAEGLDVGAPGISVRLTRRFEDSSELSLRAELVQAWTHWANLATAALFDLLGRLRKVPLRAVHVVDSRTQDRLTHRELRQLRRLLERLDGVDRVRLPRS